MVTSAAPRLVVVTKSDDRKAAEMLRRLLDAVDRGALTADTPAERRNLRRLEGMLAALMRSSTPSRSGDATRSPRVRADDLHRGEGR